MEPVKCCEMFGAGLGLVPNLLPPSISILGCPVARKRRLEEAEAEQEQDAEQPAAKRKSPPLRMALDEGFSAESDGGSEAEGEGQRSGETAETKGEEEEEDMAEDPLQDGQTNGQENGTRVEEEEEREEEEVGQKEENSFAADEGEKKTLTLTS